MQKVKLYAIIWVILNVIYCKLTSVNFIYGVGVMKIELLSPAGSMESLVAAIEAGCDAVYLGGTLFGARAFANNFDDEEIVKAIKYCHLYGVKVYVTTNILIYEHEVERFLKYVEFLHKNNVDAIIMQDLGMLDLVHKTFPNLEIHASTQMHIHNLDGVIEAKRLGVKRVVLARETPIEVVKEIKENVDMDLEIFAHGALCVSYSGQCLFSSLIGNRSGNRGSCVGSCRLPYKIVDSNNNQLNKGNYPLSMKDLNTLEYVGNLIDSGVSSLKIEGRMKSPEYVYTVTKLYRMAIDSYYETGKVNIDENELNNLKRIFNREFTKGYLFNERIDNIINDKRPNHQGVIVGKVIDHKESLVFVRLIDNIHINDGLRIICNDEDYGLVLNEFYVNNQLVKEASKNQIISFKVNKKIPKNSDVLLTKDSKLVNDINEVIAKKLRKIKINGEVILHLGMPMEIRLSDGINNVLVKGQIIEKALNNPTTKDVIIDKILKLGDTVYEFDKLNVNIDNNVFVPLKLFNELRHEAIGLLNEKRLYQHNFVKCDYGISVPDFDVVNKKSVLVSDINNVDCRKYDIVYSENSSNNVITKLPKIMHDYNNYDVNKEYLVGELGAFNRLKNISCDYSFNVTNSYTVALLHSLGARRITLSYELSPKQIKNIVDNYILRYQKHPNLEMVIYGNREVMSLKTNLNKIYDNDNLYLVDRFNNKYKLRDINGISYIYDYKLLNDKIDYYSLGVNFIRENREV